MINPKWLQGIFSNNNKPIEDDTSTFTRLTILPDPEVKHLRAVVERKDAEIERLKTELDNKMTTPAKSTVNLGGIKSAAKRRLERRKRINGLALLLKDKGFKKVTSKDVTKLLGVTQPTASAYLKELESLGVVGKMRGSQKVRDVLAPTLFTVDLNKVLAPSQRQLKWILETLYARKVGPVEIVEYLFTKGIRNRKYPHETLAPQGLSEMRIHGVSIRQGNHWHYVYKEAKARQMVLVLTALLTPDERVQFDVWTQQGSVL